MNIILLTLLFQAFLCAVWLLEKIGGKEKEKKKKIGVCDLNQIELRVRRVKLKILPGPSYTRKIPGSKSVDFYSIFRVFFI